MVGWEFDFAVKRATDLSAGWAEHCYELLVFGLQVNPANF
jgi:hypothetical protein